MGVISLSAPDVGYEEETAALEAVKSGWVAPLGPEVDAFESEIAHLADSPFAVAVNSGTAALHVGLLALGVKPGQVVITASMTFVATANAIRYVGATPVFVDSQSDGTIDPEILQEAIRGELDKGNVIGAIVPVDIYGRVADYDRIEQIAREFEIPVMADSAESVGSHRFGRPAGSFGRISVFSFNGNKIMTTSGGGMLVTSSQEIADFVRFVTQQAREDYPHYEHSVVGYNYRLSNVLAAIGRVQLRRLPSMVEKRRVWRARYATLVEPLSGVELLSNDLNEENCWVTIIKINNASSGASPGNLREHLARNSVESRPIWKPMHLQPLYQDSPYYGATVAEKLFETGLVLPSGSGMSNEDFEYVSKLLREYFSRD